MEISDDFVDDIKRTLISLSTCQYCLLYSECKKDLTSLSAVWSPLCEREHEELKSALLEKYG